MKTSHILRFIARCLGATATLGLALHAQTTIKRDTAVQDAIALFKTGKSADAVAALQAKVRTGPTASHPDLQVARPLAAVSASFRSSTDTVRASEAAALALSKLAQPEGRMTTKDAAAAYLLTGGLHEQSGDMVNAKLAYQRAVALDARLQQAVDRLARITAQEQRAAAKPAANALLRERATAAPKK